MRLPGTALIPAILMLASPLIAQRRFDVTPLFGYRSSFSAQATDESGNTGAQAHFSSGESFGAAVGVRYEETAVIEFRFTRQNMQTTFSGTSVQPVSVSLPTTLEQYHGDFTREYIFEDAKNVRPFLIGSAGATRLSWFGRSTTRFSFGIGGGVKYFPVRWFGIRAQAEWLPIWLNPEVKGFVCGGGCIVVFGGKLASQFEASFGPTFSF
jgi:hypothetical protein